MQQTLNFLSLLDSRSKKHNNPHKLQSISLKQRIHLKKRNNRYQYAKAMDFSETKYKQFPKWLIQKDGFVDFMYSNYQSKLMSIPKICQKKVRGSEQKYFLSLYLQQIPTFKGLPAVVNEIIMQNLTTKYFGAKQIIHSQGSLSEFIGIIYVGGVEYKVGKRKVVKQKDNVILLQALHNRYHTEIVSTQQTVLLTLSRTLYEQIQLKLKLFIEQYQRDRIDDLLKSTFFTQLHIKDGKAKSFYNDLELQFYLPQEVIQQASVIPNQFYIIFKGQIKEQNHIFIKEQNKWPLSNNQWEVRAVYNSFNQNDIIKEYGFFCDEEIIDNFKLKSKFTSKTWSMIFTMKASKFISHLNSEDLKRLKKYRAEHVQIDYNQLEDKVRERVKSNVDRKKIVLKAINTVLINKTEFSPRKLKLIRNFEDLMLHRSMFTDRTGSDS